MDKILLTPDRLNYRGRVYLPGGLPSSSGQTAFGRGIALRRVGTEYRLYVNTYLQTAVSPPPSVGNVIEYRVPATFSGQATFLRDLGGIQTYQTFQRYGLFWDETGQVFYLSTGVEYAGSPTPRTIVARARISPTTGKLVREGEWKVSTNWSWRACQGGVTNIPQWFNDQYLSSTQRLGIGFGGVFSVVGSGPVSMGPALAAMPPPVAGEATVPVTPLQGYPFRGSQRAYPRQHRETNYKQYFENVIDSQTGPTVPRLDPTLVPVDPLTEPPGDTGFWNQADIVDSCGTWVDLDNVSGMIYLATWGTLCNWYGSNYGWKNICSNQVGSAATINSSRKDLYLLITDPDDLAAVAQGASPTSIQSTWSQHLFTGLTQPFVGWPNERFKASGLSSAGPMVVMGLYQGLGPPSNQPWYYFYEIDDTVEGPPPLTAPTLWLPLNGATDVTDVTTTGSVVRWNPSPNATGYRVYHGTQTSPPLLITLTTAAAASVTFPGTCETPVTRSLGVRYYWRVEAVRDATTASSVEYSYTTAAPVPIAEPPAAVTDVRVI